MNKCEYNFYKPNGQCENLFILKEYEYLILWKNINLTKLSQIIIEGFLYYFREIKNCVQIVVESFQ